MDPNEQEHRLKRSRFGSTEGDHAQKFRTDVAKDSCEHANPGPPAPLSTATTALQNISLQDIRNHGVNPTPHLVKQPYNQNPPASFLSHPSFHRSGIPAANLSFDPSLNQNESNNHCPSFPIAEDSAAHPRLTLSSNDPNGTLTRPGLGSQAINLPLHGPRYIQPSSGLVVGPSLIQAERDAHHPPPQKDFSSHNPFAFQGCQPILPAMPQIYHPYRSSSEVRTPEQKMSRPWPIYVSAQKEGNTKNPFTCTNGISAYLQNPGSMLVKARKQGSTSDNNPSEIGLSTDSHSTIDAEHPFRAMRDDSATSLYPSIYPGNERHFDGKWPSDFSYPLSPPGYPSNHYTSPNRVPNAAFVASRKRKRGWPVLPPPAYVYTRTNHPNFNIFGGILLYPELCFALAANLPVNDLVSLYAISKDFHTIIDTRFATVILSQSLRKCPESSHIFPFRCYKYLCRPDPAPRIPHPHPAKQAAGEIRKVASFRWLKMVLFREKACHEIMTVMAEDGVPLPSRCELALKKMWFLMDIPDNARRIGYMHTKKLMTDLDLYFMMCFVVKLDLRFNDPAATNRYHGLRKTILAQRGLLPLWRALKRGSLLTKHDMLKMWVATKYKPPADEEGLPMFGVPGNEVGKIKMEYWGERAVHDTGKACTFLLRPDQLLMREIIRRNIVFSKHFLRCLLWGYVNIVTMENYQPRVWNRKIKELNDEYEGEDECGADDQPASSEQDELLDLGIKKPVSILVSREDHVQIESRERRSKEDAFLEECMKWYKDESQSHSKEAH